jgi:hypothetical protein
MGAAVDVSAEFQRRRSATWRASRLWLLLGIIAAVVFWLQPKGNSADMSETQFTLSLISFVVMGVSIVAITFSVRRLYRCPNCGAIPMGSWATLGPTSFSLRRDVDLNPSTCGNCGAKLRAEA